MLYLVGSEGRTTAWILVHVEDGLETVGNGKWIMVLPFALEDLGITFAILRILPAFEWAII